MFDFVTKNSRLHLAIVLVVITMIGLLTVNDFGISWDERMEVEMVQWNWKFATQGTPYPVDLIRYYGLLFNGFAELVFQLQRTLQGLLTTPAPLVTEQEVLAAKIYSKHTLTFLWTLLAYGSVAGLISLIYGRAYAWVAPLILALFPRFWAHSFFNPKDIPFAALFTLVTWIGVGIVEAFLGIKQKDVKHRYLLTQALSFGCLVGALCCIRLGGIVVLGFVAIAYLTIRIGQRIRVQEMAWCLLYYSLMVISCLSTIFVFYPAAWKNPLSWLLEGLKVLGDYPLKFLNLFAGQEIIGSSTPWNYIPQWFAVTIPLIFSLLLILGVLLALTHYRNFSNRQRIAIILVGLQVFFLPAAAILKRSSLYDEVRHFLFMVPGIAVFSAIALIWLYKKMSRLPLKVGFIFAIAIVFLQIVQDMSTLHPYEHVYFNRVSGGLAAAKDRYETEYWGLSLREAANWLEKQVPEPGKRILVLGPYDVLDIVKRPDFRLVKPQLEFQVVEEIPRYQVNEDLATYSSKEEKDKELYIVSIRRFRWQNAFPQCPIVHEVKRQDVGLAVIRHCSTP